MLVLTRKKDEQIVIRLGDQDVIVQVVDIDRTKVRLGVTAPADIPIYREEVLQRLHSADAELVA